MPGTNSESKIGVALTVTKDDLVAAFKDATEEMKKLDAQSKKTSASTSGLGSALKSLGVAALAYKGLDILFGVMKDGFKSALEDEAATRNLTGTLSNLGLESEKVKKQIEDFVEQQGKLGQGGSETETGLAKLVSITHNVTDAITLSGLASDLAASHLGTYTENVDLLQTILMGKGNKALEAYGIRMGKNATVGQQLVALSEKITTSQEQLATTSEGQLKRLGEAWDNFKTGIGKIGLWFADTFITNWLNDLTTLGDFTVEMFGKVAKSISGFFSDVKNSFDNIVDKKIGEKYGGAVSAVRSGQKGGEDISNLPKAFNDIAAKAKGPSEEMKKKLLGIGSGFKTVGEEGAKGADKTKEAFRDMSKAVIDALQEQQKGIDDLRAAQKKLTAQLDEDLAKSNDKYKGDATEIARRAKQRVDEIAKQIEDENSTMSEGFRGRIEELKAEMAKEQAIIDQAGTINSNLKEDIAKTDLQILQDAHEKELAEIRSQNEKKRKEAQDEIDARKFQINRIGANLYDPNFYKNSSAEANSFLGSIGQGQMQQALVFNFNGTVAGDEGVKEIITQAISEINRQATVQKVGGK